MYVLPSADDPEFREAAKAVVIYAKDMVPVQGQPGTWRLPFRHRPALMTPEMRRLFFLVTTKKLGTVGPPRPRKRITLVRGPDILSFSKDTPPVEDNHFIVMILLESPVEQQNAMNFTLTGQEENGNSGDRLAATTTEALSQAAEVAITNSTLIDYHVGDVLRLDATDILYPKGESFLAMILVYDWRDVLKEDQTTKEEVSPAV